MKNNVKDSKNILFALALLMLSSLISCSELTEIENIGIKTPNKEEQNKELYDLYLKNLRAYKTSEHPLIIGWFDNSDKSSYSRASHIEALPDSIDIVILTHGDNLTKTEVEQMRAVRSDKGTRMCFSINYTKIETLWATINEKQRVGSDEVAQTDVDGFLEFMSANLDEQLALVDKYNYDGIMVNYIGQNIGILPTEQDKELVMARQKLFFNKFTEYNALNQDKLMIFEGVPVNVFNKDNLNIFKYVVISARDILSVNQLDFILATELGAGIPKDRTIVAIDAFSPDETDVKTGSFFDEFGRRLSAVVEVAHWVNIPNMTYKKSGLGIYGINNDYYNPEMDYKFSRQAMFIMNPAPGK